MCFKLHCWSPDKALTPLSTFFDFAVLLHCNVYNYDNIPYNIYECFIHKQAHQIHARP